jgi:ATP-dependent DNA helicase HFM1/MER3
MVLSAPTGSGKTVVMELAMLRLWNRCVDTSGRFNHAPGRLKTVYLAPARALVQERVEDWAKRFSPTLGIKFVEMTGDTEMEEIGGLDDTDVICTTPEKFDAVTRRNRDRGGMRFFSEVGYETLWGLSLLAVFLFHSLLNRIVQVFPLGFLNRSSPPPLQIALVLVDEVHLLNESRGSSLEAGVISRIKLVGTLPEVKDVSMKSGIKSFACSMDGVV